jgi:hypothetical protein
MKNGRKRIMTRSNCRWNSDWTTVMSWNARSLRSRGFHLRDRKLTRLRHKTVTIHITVFKGIFMGLGFPRLPTPGWVLPC